MRNVNMEIIYLENYSFVFGSRVKCRILVVNYGCMTLSNAWVILGGKYWVGADLIMIKCRNSFIFKLVNLVNELCCVDMCWAYIERLKGKK